MRPYLNLSGDSDITDYKIGEGYIDVKFKSSSTIYYYSNSKTGELHVDVMKILAVSGQGLCTYINENPLVKNNYGKR